MDQQGHFLLRNSASSETTYLPMSTDPTQSKQLPHRRWVEMSIDFGVFMLPSFLHGSFYAKVYPGRPRHSQPNSRVEQGTAFLDGMRGMAAVCVFLEHLFIPFWETIYYAYHGHQDTTILQMSGIRLLYSGSPMVCIFFVISGAALSLKPMQLLSDSDLPSFYELIQSMVFRRGIRLYLPCLLASFVFMVAAHLHLCDPQSAISYSGPRELREEFWEKQPKQVSDFGTQLQQWLSFITARVLIPSTWRGTTTGHDFGDAKYIEYGSQLWTIGVEYWSSLLLFLALLATAKHRQIYRLAEMAALSTFSFWVSRWDVCLFFYGSVLAQTSLPSPKPRSFLFNTLTALVFILALHLASFPELGGSHTPGFAALSSISANSRTWQSLGAALIVTSIANSNFLRAGFCCDTLLYLGQISFPIYIIHLPMLDMFGWRMVNVILQSLESQSFVERSVCLTVALVINFVILLWAADLFHRLVDMPCMLLGKRLETILEN